jgi:hypothetical protein
MNGKGIQHLSKTEAAHPQLPQGVLSLLIWATLVEVTHLDL